MHKIILPQDWNVSNWNGGTTSELLINPKGADFKKGDYSLRISIATVEVDESTFTSLENVDRVLTVLEGEIELIHEGHHSTVLKPYEQDSFSGNWSTKSIGKVRDFNVMTKNNDVETIVFKLSTNENLTVNRNEFYFIAEGNVVLNRQILEKNTSFIPENDDQIQISENSVLICSK